MKISNASQNYINQSYTNATNTGAAGKSGAQDKPSEEKVAQDSINLSSTTRDLQKISAASETEPAGRTQMVQDLKDQVQAGQYTVNAEQVAEKMIGTIMDELG
ncbi:MAG TPA: flagellar biosynthesis anti-sigma factor FlgM [Desulfobacteraceae bacterium]|nr:flagellar biosynthesis anti-sigma factor FlgM [Desulfobacteraceae bacterium]|tara:strand:- start:251 stop:559 length:309 start_codon:yes stop_codon:yes gene_type:complete